MRYSRDSVTGILSFTGHSRAYPVTLSRESCYAWEAFMYIL